MKKVITLIILICTWFGAASSVDAKCVHPEDFYTPTDGADWQPSITRAIVAASIPDGVPNGLLAPTPGVGGCVRLTAPFKYHMDHQLVVDRATDLGGEAGGGWYSGSVIECAPGVADCVLFASTAAWSHLHDLTVRGQVKAGTTKGIGGLHLQSRVHVDHVYVSYFGGQCVWEDGVSTTGVNGWTLILNQIDQCDGDGVLINGAGNSNAGLAMGNGISYAKGIAFDDQSFLGNTYVGNEVATSGGSYSCARPSQRCAFFGNYTESDTPAPNVTIPSLWLGGTTSIPTGNGYYMVDGHFTAMDSKLALYTTKMVNVVPTSTIGYRLGDELKYMIPVAGGCASWRLIQQSGITKWKCSSHMDP